MLKKVGIIGIGIIILGVIGVSSIENLDEDLAVEEPKEQQPVPILDNTNDITTDVKIIIQGDSDQGSFNDPLLQGFLASARIEMDKDLVRELKPHFWRVGDFGSNQIVRELIPDVKTQIVLSDLFVEKAATKPWTNWDEYEQKVRTLVQHSKDNSPVDYWDVWSEPDHLWTGTTEQFFETVKRTHDVIRAVDPDANLVGPSISYYDEKFLETYLDFLVANNLQFDAISWHEFNIPEELPSHVNSVRNMIAERPALGNMEIQINEFVSGQNHLIPGWTAGWIYYLEEAEVDWANRACWEREIGDMALTSECVKGLNGVFAEDEKTPQAVYWVHKYYADMKGTKLYVNSLEPKVVALASKVDDSESIQIMVGRYSCGQTNAWCNFSPSAVPDTPFSPINLEIVLDDYPYVDVTSVKVSTEKIPFFYGSVNLPRPQMLEPYSLVVKNNTISILISNFGDGEVLRLLLEPES